MRRAYRRLPPRRAVRRRTFVHPQDVPAARALEEERQRRFGQRRRREEEPPAVHHASEDQRDGLRRLGDSEPDGLVSLQREPCEPPARVSNHAVQRAVGELFVTPRERRSVRLSKRVGDERAPEANALTHATPPGAAIPLPPAFSADKQTRLGGPAPPAPRVRRVRSHRGESGRVVIASPPSVPPSISSCGSSGSRFCVVARGADRDLDGADSDRTGREVVVVADRQERRRRVRARRDVMISSPPGGRVLDLHRVVRRTRRNCENATT